MNQTLTADSGLSSYMSKVYNWMTLGLIVTALLSFLVTNTSFGELFYTYTNTRVTGATILGWLAILSPLGFVLVMGLGYEKLSTFSIQMLFFALCACVGISLGVTFSVYAGTSIFLAFLIASSMFLAMSIVGYTTNIDLTKFGSFLLMGLIGIIIAMIANIFIGSTILTTVISVIGVLVFCGLTAFDTQRIKDEYSEYDQGKSSVMDALSLYLNLLNLFQFVLQLIGIRNND